MEIFSVSISSVLYKKIVEKKLTAGAVKQITHNCVLITLNIKKIINYQSPHYIFKAIKTLISMDMYIYWLPHNIYFYCTRKKYYLCNKRIAQNF